MKKKYAYMKTNWFGLMDLTPFKRYEIIEWIGKNLFTISDDNGKILACCVFSSAHLGGDEWYLTNDLN
jgi:hypothetical protein